MATVYLADDVKHKRQVAVKVLEPEIVSEVGPQRFLREIGIAARLQHPAILPLHDSGEAEGLLYYIMPYVKGESLRDRLEREGQLSIEDSLRIAGEVADGLEYAHEHGVVHRDIKPENILLSGEHALISDFGIARAITEAGGERVTQTGHAVGTPAYMSPEQASGETDIDGRSDIYSLACVLYEMLAGEAPFTGRTAQAVIARHMLEQPPSLQIVRPSVPQEVLNAVEVALAKVPADRFATASDFRAALEVPTEIAVPDRWLSWARRVAIAGLVAVAAAALVVALQAILRREDPLNPDRIVVFPLADAGVSDEHAGAGWDVALAIGAALEHTRPLKWIDGWSRLDETVRQNASLLTPEVAAGISHDRRARFYVGGAIRKLGDRLAVVLQLYDVVGDSLIAQESAFGDIGSSTPSELGLSAVNSLLPKLLDPEREVDLTALTERAQGANALWLQGERQYRRSQFREALDLYRRAVAEDTLHAFAAVKGAQAASWIKRHSAATEMIARAIAHDTLLPPHYVHFAHGLGAYLVGRADSAVARFKAALEQEPEWSEAAMALGEVYFHLLPNVGAALDSLAKARFGDALALDSAFTPPLQHLAEIAVREGELERANSYMQRLSRAGSDTSRIRHLNLMYDCVQKGAANFSWDEAARDSTGAVLVAGKNLAVAGSQVECARGAFRAVRAIEDAPYPHRWTALLGLQNVLIAQGRVNEALASVDSAVAAGETVAKLLYVFDALLGIPAEEEAAETEEFAREVTGEYYETTGHEARWLLGIWNAQHFNVGRVARIASQLQEESEDDATGLREALGSGLMARVSLLDGDTASALQTLRSLAPTLPLDSLTWDMSDPLPLERMLIARLLLVRGEYEEAYSAASVFDHPGPLVFVALLPASLEIRIAAARALNRPRLVAHLEERVTRLSGR